MPRYEVQLDVEASVWLEVEADSADEAEAEARDSYRLVQISVDVTDPDPALAAQQAADLFDVLRTRYPRENGGAQ